MKRFERGNHFFEVIDVLPVDDQVCGESDAVLADPRGQFHLVRVRARSGNPVRMAFARILKTELDMVKTRFHQLGQALAGESDSRGDQVGVETRLARALDQMARSGRASGSPPVR